MNCLKNKVYFIGTALKDYKDFSSLNKNMIQKGVLLIVTK